MDPIKRFRQWYAQAQRAKLPEPDAATLATADRRGRPSARYVLLKDVDARGFVFCSNTTSRKHRDLTENPRASMVFYWRELDRQLRIDGRVEEIPRPEAVLHWMARPRESRLAALASRQSRPLKSRAALLAEFRRQVRAHEGREVLAPATWTGYRIRPERIEFWTRGAHRLHHREVFTRTSRGWRGELLNP